MNGTPHHLADILDAATAAVLILDAAHRCTYMNPAAEALTGYARAELHGRVLHDVIHFRRPDGRPLALDECPIGRAIARGERAHGEEVFIHRDGRFYDVAFAASAIHEGDAVVGSVLELRDITAERRREARRRLLAGISDAIARDEPLDDVLEHAVEHLGRLLRVRSCEFSAIDEDAGTLDVVTSWRDGPPPLRGRHAMDAIFLGEFPQALRRGEPVAIDDTATDARVDATHYGALGIRAFAIAPFVQGGVLRFCVSATDAAPRAWGEDDVRLLRAVAARVFPYVERRRHDQALRLSEERFRTMADAVPHMVWITRADGSPEFLNRVWRQYTGRALDAQGRAPPMDELLHPDDVAPSIAVFDAARASGRAFTLEHRMRSADGDYRWFIVRGEPYRDPGTGEIVRWFGSSADVHELKLAQQALAEADRRKDEFLAMLAHELRNPLAPIATGARLLERVADEPERVRELARVVNRQVAHIRDLVDDLLDVSRVTRGLITLREDVHDVAGIVAGAMEQSRADLDARGHRLDIALPPEPLHVRGDRTRLIQVLANLLNNAAKYSPDGARIAVEVAREHASARIVVADTGQGIDAALLPHVFDLFSQGMRTPERAHGGLGLGLALVRHLVQLHGGSVDAASEGPGRGSRFTVRLPLAVGPLHAPSPSTVDAAPARTLRIVLVDDNHDAAATLASALAFFGHDVEVHGDASSVLAAQWPAPPDAFLLDIGLPGMDGRALAQRLRDRNDLGSSRFVAITGYGSSADVAASHDAGFDHHLVKPVDFDALLRVLDVPA